MNNIDKTQNLIVECRQIHEDAMYTAETHYQISCKHLRLARVLKITATAVTIIASFFLLIGAPNWVAWFCMISGVATILSAFLDPERSAREHDTAGKSFTILKHDSRFAHEVSRQFMSEQEFFHRVEGLRERYNSLVQMSPSTRDEKAWAKARTKVKSGVHTADFRQKK